MRPHAHALERVHLRMSALAYLERAVGEAVGAVAVLRLQADNDIAPVRCYPVLEQFAAAHAGLHAAHGIEHKLKAAQYLHALACRHDGKDAFALRLALARHTYGQLTAAVRTPGARHQRHALGRKHMAAALAPYVPFQQIACVAEAVHFRPLPLRLRKGTHAGEESGHFPLQ